MENVRNTTKTVKGKNILITGVAGFIGSQLIDELIENNKIICYDNLSTGNWMNIDHLMGNENFRFIEYDISKPLKMDYKVDQIYHLASPASPIDYKKLPLETMLANSLGTLNMLELAKEKKARFLLASTSEVYGDPNKHPQDESYWGHVNPLGSRSCYNESKRFAEAITMEYHKIYGIDVKIARIFNTYGPRMRKNDGRVIPNFITQALNGKPITVYGKGKQTRSFCYISDMVEGLIKLMESEHSDIYNLGSTNEMKIIDVAKKIKEMTESKSDIIFNPLPQDDPKRRKPNIAKAEQKLKWKPRVNFDEGLKKTIEWFTFL